ncbi:MAG: hypothetical protein LW715_06250 [Rhodobacter sp.]|nr:hypothetical protein [Rhodobacter sp.]
MSVINLSASELSRRIAAGDLAPSDVMAAFLGQIAALNPEINAVVSLRDPDLLLAEARAADDRALPVWCQRPMICCRVGCARRGRFSSA